jgi:hypothetical protein
MTTPFKVLPVVLLLALPAGVQAQFNFTTNNGAITITWYTGVGGDVTIPDVTNGLPVGSIAATAFKDKSSVTSVTIPYSVTNIGLDPFQVCFGLTNIVVDPLNPAFSSVDGVLFNQDRTILLQYPRGRAGAYSVPGSVRTIEAYAFEFCPGLTSVAVSNGVTSIGHNAFDTSTALTNVTLPTSLTNIGMEAFFSCTSLTGVTLPEGLTSVGTNQFEDYRSLASLSLPNTITRIADSAFAGDTSLTNFTIPASVTNIGQAAFGARTTGTRVYFKGNAPTVTPASFDHLNTTIYYLPGTTNWGPTLSGCPTVLWNPQPQRPAVQANQFGFTITGTTNIPIVVEANTGMANPGWTALQTCTLTNGSIYFTDPDWTNHPIRLYRIRSP